MNAEELIKELQKYDGKTIISIDYTFNDSDEGLCYDSINNFIFEYAENKEHKFLTIKEAED